MNGSSLAWFPLHPALRSLLPPTRWPAVLGHPQREGAHAWIVSQGQAWLWSTTTTPMPSTLLDTLTRTSIPRIHVMVPSREALPCPPRGWRALPPQEVLCWERPPDRGVLHDPPLRWRPIPVSDYLALRHTWHAGTNSWFRHPACVRGWGEHVPLEGYVLDGRDGHPRCALLLWRPVTSFVYVVDCAWASAETVRQHARYLLQELYLHHREAHALLEFETVNSPLNPVLMALGYRVHRRWWAQTWHVASP